MYTRTTRSQCAFFWFGYSNIKRTKDKSSSFISQDKREALQARRSLVYSSLMPRHASGNDKSSSNNNNINNKNKIESSRKTDDESTLITFPLQPILTAPYNVNNYRKTKAYFIIINAVTIKIQWPRTAFNPIINILYVPPRSFPFTMYHSPPVFYNS